MRPEFAQSISVKYLTDYVVYKNVITKNTYPFISFYIPLYLQSSFSWIMKKIIFHRTISINIFWKNFNELNSISNTVYFSFASKHVIKETAIIRNIMGFMSAKSLRPTH